MDRGRGIRVRYHMEYHDWAANVDLSPALFEIATWTSAPHWAGKH